MATYDLKYPGAAIDAILDTAYHLQQAGYIFRGSASDYSGTPTEREWVIAPAGFSGLGLSSAVPQGSIGICLYSGTAWVGKVINVLTLDSQPTRNSQNGVTSGGVAATLDEIAGGIMATFASLLFDDETAAADLSTKLSYAVKFSVSDVYQTVTHLNILAATTSKAGLMSAEDKAKVDSFLTNLRSLTFADTTASADQGTKITETLKATIGGVQEVIDSITILAATSSKAGLLSASDKAYIDALPATLTSLSNSISGALALMQSLVGYYVCDTAAGTAAKTVAATGYSLTNGGCIRIKMTNANTATNVTLNINSTGAKALYYDGTQASSTNTWEAGEVLEVYYDGTQYQCASGGGGKFASGESVGEVNIFNQKDGIIAGKTNIPSSLVLYGDMTMTSNDFEQGSGDPNTGEMVANTRRIRTKNFIRVVKGGTISFTYNNQPYVIYYYDNNKGFISSTSWASVTADIAVEDDGYVKILVKKTNDDVIIPSELADVITISGDGLDDRVARMEEELDGLFATSQNGDFEISDESENVLVRFKDGHIMTKNFDSSTDVPLSEDETMEGDLEFSDESENVLVRFKNGHVMTKNFDSSKIGDIEYYATQFEQQEQALYDKVRNDIDDKTVVLLLTTDAHITTEEQYTLKYAKAFRKMAENIGADAIVSLGDIINEKVGSGWDITANRDRIELYMKDTRNTYIPFLYALAHHEMFSSGYPTFLYGYPATKVLGKTGKYQRYMIPVFDQDNYANFYVDVKPQGIRMIFLDSANVAGHPVGYTQATVDWLTSTLANTTGKIALFTHVPSKNGYSYNPNNSISRVVNDDLVRTALNNYVQGGGDILGHYCGHAHCDNYGKESDMEYYIIQTACSVPRVDGGVPAAERPTLGTPIYYSDRAVGTLNEWCVDVACIHCDIDEVHMFRFGVGNDRVIQL